MHQHKIIFTGTTGAGKTTAIGLLSDMPPVSTDVRNTDPDVHKATTTAGLDYGELTLDNGDRLRLYGTPGQQRFDFMWKILARGALGVIILIDNSRTDPLADLEVYLDGFTDLIAQSACVVAIGRMEQHAQPGLEAFASLLTQRGVLCPVLPVDVREAAQVSLLLDMLLLQLEVKVESANP